MHSILSIIGEQLLLSVLLYGIYVILFERENMFVLNRVYLLCSLIIVMITPFLSFEWIPHYIEIQHLLSNVTTPELEIGSAAPMTTQLKVDYVLIGFQILYSIGLLFIISKLVYQLQKIQQLKKSGCLYENENISFCIRNDISTPFSFLGCIYSPTMELPKEIMEHEKVHIRHRHTMDNIYTEICKAFMWYNPFVYLFQRRLKEVHEYTCDYITANKINNLPAYAQFLLEFNAKGTTPILVNSFQSQIKKRILMLKNASQSNSSKGKKYLVIPILLILFFGFNVESYSVVKVAQPNRTFSYSDTIPHSETTVVDTLVVFDNETFNETFYSIQNIEGNDYNTKSILNHSNKKYVNPELYNVIDTVVYYDNNTNKEGVEILQYEKEICNTIKWGQPLESVSVKNRTELELLLKSDIELLSLSDDCKDFSGFDYNVFLQFDNNKWQVIGKEKFEEDKQKLRSQLKGIQSLIISDIIVKWKGNGEMAYTTKLPLEYHLRVQP